MLQSISTYFRLSANHADKQVMLHVLAKQWKCAISDISDVKTAIILIEFLIKQNKTKRTIYKRINRLINHYFLLPYCKHS